MLVKGGPANSGSKRPLREKGKDSWRCECGTEHRYYVARCGTCRVKRDAHS